MKSFSASKRFRVYAKTNGRCAYCGDAVLPELLCIDHVQARARGGSNDLDNLNPCCRRCNTCKGIKTIEEFRLYMASRRSKHGIQFTQVQLDALREAGLLEAIGIPLEHQFFFEESSL